MRARFRPPAPVAADSSSRARPAAAALDQREQEAVALLVRADRGDHVARAHADQRWRGGGRRARFRRRRTARSTRTWPWRRARAAARRPRAREARDEKLGALAQRGEPRLRDRADVGVSVHDRLDPPGRKDERGRRRGGGRGGRGGLGGLGFRALAGVGRLPSLTATRWTRSQTPAFYRFSVMSLTSKSRSWSKPLDSATSMA